MANVLRNNSRSQIIPLCIKKNKHYGTGRGKRSHAHYNPQKGGKKQHTKRESVRGSQRIHPGKTNKRTTELGISRSCLLKATGQGFYFKKRNGPKKLTSCGCKEVCREMQSMGQAESLQGVRAFFPGPRGKRGKGQKVTVFGQNSRPTGKRLP